MKKVREKEKIGFLPDTFNICGDIFADPTSPNGQAPDAVEALSRSLAAFAVTIPSSSIPFIQVADAELPLEPLTVAHPWMEGCTNAKMAWSRNARLFPMEKEGYLPILDVLQAVVKTGWSGWVSQEVFSRVTAVEGDETVWELADRAWKGWEKLALKMEWEPRPRNRQHRQW